MPSFDDNILKTLERYARNAVLDAGIAAMRYYREALRSPMVMDSGVNASTEADIQATLAAISSLGSAMHHLDARYSVYGEELDVDYNQHSVRQRMDEELPRLRNAANVVRSGTDFITGFNRHIAVLIDGIDGTTNFRTGLPIFCSAAAIFVDGHLRVGAVYDPHHHVVYYGALPEKAPSRAHMWVVSSGENTPLTPPGTGKDLLIASHFTRGRDKKSTEKRSAMLATINQLVHHCAGHYQLNSGLLALTYVAADIFSGFVNNYTNPWDVAAAQVLIEAVGGCVTDFEGNRINYASPGKIDVLAAGNPVTHAALRKILSSSKHKLFINSEHTDEEPEQI